MAEHFNCHIDTVTVWVRDPRVQAHAGRFAIERINRITRKIDETIDGRLAHASKMDTELLLKIRKEFLGGAFRALHEGGKVDEATIYEAQDAVQADPELLSGLRELLERRAEAQALEDAEV